MTTDFEYKSDNIIVGNAELPAIRTNEGLCWMLPGNIAECDKNVAVKYAQQLDVVITANLAKYSRKILKAKFGE